jgi:hypothetical protein
MTSVVLKLSTLPPQLTELSWHAPKVSFKPGEKLPASLTKLFWTVPPAATFNPVELLPEGLLDLTLLGLIASSYLKPGSLPQGLKQLTIADVSLQTFVECCPPNVTGIGIHLMYFMPTNPTLDLVKALPQSVKSISDVLAYRLTPELAAALPRSLEYISDPVSLSAVPHMPNSITILEIIFNDLDPVDDSGSEDNSEYGNESDDLEDSVDEIAIASSSNAKSTKKNSINKSVPEPIKSFPSCLLLLDIGIPLEPERYVPYLPPSLTELKAYTPVQTEELSKQLPRALEVLEFRNHLGKDRQKILKAFPASLTHLAISLFRHSPRNNRSTESYDDAKIVDARCFSERIRILDLQVPSVNTVWFLNLPPTLTSLKLGIQSPLMHEISSDHRPLRFPDLLNNLEIDFKLPYSANPRPIAVKFIQNLPRLLSRFSLGFASSMLIDSGIQNEDLRTLPLTLESLILPPSAAIDQNCLPLPRRLSYLSLGTQTPSWFL